jgi:hypothetical protein
VIGWDGGLLPEPYEVDSLVIAPGERYDVLVELEGAEGDTLELQTLHYDRGHELPDLGARPIATITLAAPPENPAPALPERWGEITPLPITADTPRRMFTLSEEEAEGPDDEPRFFINERAWPDVDALVVASDALEIWEITNDARWTTRSTCTAPSSRCWTSRTSAGRTRSTCPQKSTVKIAVALRQPGPVDVPLPHPRAHGARHDGRPPGRRVMP